MIELAALVHVSGYHHHAAAAQQLCMIKQVAEALDLAQRLGLTVVRTWAFTDGTAQFAPLQPELGQLDSAIFA